MTRNPPYPKAPVDLPGPSDVPHFSTRGEIKHPGRGTLLQQLEAWVGRVIRSVLSRARGTAPTETDS